MKHLIIALILTTSLFANEKIWSSHSAEILEQGRWEIGLFQPLRYGYSNYAEFSIHPGWFFLIPNLEIKYLCCVTTEVFNEQIVSSCGVGGAH